MVIQHNISALNAHRQLGINNKHTAGNLEKLSSGYRINRAGDDAAGLAISEKMRGQIRGLAMAETNCSNGISLIQTAEGGLQETHDILQRMRELAVQSANGTYQNETDRENLERELQALKSEIDRIASATHYNGINLLDGSMGGISTAGAAAAGNAAFDAAASIGVDLGTFTFTPTVAADFAGKTATLNMHSDGTDITSASLIVGDKTYMIALANGNFGDTTTVANGVYEMGLDGKMTQVGTVAGLTYTGIQVSGVITGIELDDTNGAVTAGDLNAATSTAYVAVGSSELIFQIGANGTADQRVGLHVNNMSTGNLGSHEAVGNNTAGTIAGISIALQDDANAAIDVIDAAINQVSATRADLGALQNRLEHTVNNLGVTKENLTAAESTIRDVDMAKEMMEYTKNSILVQASQAMLAQANTLPQGVLQLLQ